MSPSACSRQLRVGKTNSVSGRGSMNGLQPQLKTTTPLAGMVVTADAGKPCRGGTSALMPPELPATCGLI